jgi:Domain of unknown function (DUF4337)
MAPLRPGWFPSGITIGCRDQFEGNGDMVDPVDTAHEQIEAADHRHGDRDPWSRWMAMAVSFLAASLALAELGAKSSQTGYLTHNIVASDTWNAYQAKNLRANLWHTQSLVMESLPNAADPAVQARIKMALSEEARMHDEPEAGDGMKQLRERAKLEEQERDFAFHAYHGFEYASSVLEIAIVLVSVSVITRIRTLGVAAGVIGLLACAYGLAVFVHFV